MPEPRRLVVLAPNWLGDAVMALPAIADVRRRWPDATLAVAARSGLAPLFESVPGVEEVVPLEAAPPRLSVASDARRLKDGAFDAAVLLPNAFRAALVTWRARIPERWGYATDRRGWLLTRPVEPPETDRLHQADYYRHLTAALQIASGPRHPVVRPRDEARARARTALADAGWRTGPLVGLAPGAAYGSAKRWPPERVGLLAARLVREFGATPVLVGAAGDCATAAEVVAAAVAAGVERSALVDLTGRTDLPTLIGVLDACAAFVSNDSGAMHLAAALDVPVTAVFGPTREWATSPLPGPAGHAATIVHTDVDCRPCMLRTCPIDHRCMTRIGVDDVLGPVARALRERSLA
jgi:heptosyltransferase-2